MLAAGIAVLGALHWFAEHTSQMQWFCWDSESCSGSEGQETTRMTVTFVVQVWLWEMLWSFFSI